MIFRGWSYQSANGYSYPSFHNIFEMASFQIHDDQENSLPDSNILRKETIETTKNQRRALGGINPNNNQQRILKSVTSSFVISFVVFLLLI